MVNDIQEWLESQKEYFSKKLEGLDIPKEIVADFANLFPWRGVDWKDIHKDFSKEWYSKTYQQKWEEYGLTYEEAKKLIKTGLTPLDYEFAFYLKQNNYQPSHGQLTFENLTELKNRYHNAQNWLDFWYPKESTCIRKDFYNVNDNNFGKTRQKITYLDISEKNLQGYLNLEEFDNLKHLHCYKNKLTGLDLNSISLKELICWNNELTYLNFLNTLNPKSLLFLNVKNNKISSNLTPFGELVNLEELYLDNNNFYGSSEPLKNLTRLRKLHIGENDINIDLEYLPSNIEELDSKTIVNFLKDEFKNKNGQIKQLQFEIEKIEEQKISQHQQDKKKIDFLNGMNVQLKDNLQLVQSHANYFIEKTNLFRQNFKEIAFQSQLGQAEPISQQFDSANILLFYLLYHNRAVRNILKKIFTNPFADKTESERVQLEKNNNELKEILESELAKKEREISKLEETINKLKSEIEDLQNNNEEVDGYKKQLKEAKQKLNIVQKDKEELEKLYSLALKNIGLITNYLKKINMLEKKHKVNSLIMSNLELNKESNKLLELLNKEVEKYAGEEEFIEVIQQVKHRFDYWQSKK